MDIEIGGDTFTKKPNILEEIAYSGPGIISSRTSGRVSAQRKTGLWS